MLENYLPVLIFIVVGTVVGAAMIDLGFVLRRIDRTGEEFAYECGFEAFEDSRMKFDVRYYLVAILFIIFDLEIAFLFPWAVVLDQIGMVGFWAMMIFPGILVVGFIYEWKKGLWNGNRGRPRQGFFSPPAGRVINWARTGSMWPMTFGLACCAVEMMRAAAARYDIDRSAWCSAQSASVGRDDRCRYAGEQDGARVAQGVMTDGRAALGHLDGFLRQRRWLLPLLLCRARMRSYVPVDVYVPGCPPTAGSPAVGHSPVAEQDPPDQHDSPLIPLEPIQ